MSLPKYFKAIENHLSLFLEDSEILVFDEIKSKDFHLDVYYIKPNKNVNYIILLTNGVSSKKMITPFNEYSKYIELAVLLPNTWQLDGDNWKKETNYWPIELLKGVGRYPHQNKTWLGYGHTIPENGYIGNTNFTAILLLKSKTLPIEFQTITKNFKVVVASIFKHIFFLHPLFFFYLM